MPLSIHCSFSSMSITCLLASFSLGSLLLVRWRGEVLGKHCMQLPSPLQGLSGKAMGFQLPWTRVVCRSYGLVASTFALFVVASVGMQRKCQPWNSLIPPSVGLNSLPLIQCLFLCALPGVFFLTPCVTCYFSANVGRHNTASRAKQHSVSQTAACIHAEMNNQFQSRLKIKKYTQLLLFYSSFDCCSLFTCFLSWLGLRQGYTFLSYPSKTSPNCCDNRKFWTMPKHILMNSFWADVHALLFAFYMFK